MCFAFSAGGAGEGVWRLERFAPRQASEGLALRLRLGRPYEFNWRRRGNPISSGGGCAGGSTCPPPAISHRTSPYSATEPDVDLNVSIRAVSAEHRLPAYGQPPSLHCIAKPKSWA